MATYAFPRYEEESSHFVKAYQNGNYGPADEVSPYTASLFYALDRYEASKSINEDLESGKIVIANRYVGANMASQGSKFSDPVEQRGFFVWNDNLEYELLKLPRPDTNLFLRVPAEVSFGLIEKKATSGQPKGDINHLKTLVATYDLLCQLFPKDFKTIDCVKKGRPMSIPEISNIIWNKLKPILPVDKPKAGHSAVVTLGEPEPPKSMSSGKDSPDRLTVPFRSASLRLRQQIEMIYPGSTVPKISFWSDSGFEFYMPQDLPKDLKPAYRDIIIGLAAKHGRLTDGLKSYYTKNSAVKGVDLRGVSYLVDPVTPLCAVIPFEAVIEKSEVMPLARHLLEAELPEAQWAAKQLYLMARQVWPDDFKQPLETTDAVTPVGSLIARMAPGRLSAQSDNQTIKLLEATPRQEFDLLAESIYPFSTLSLDEITAEVAEWPYQQKYDSLRQAAAQPSILREVHYKMDVLSDQISLRRLAESANLQQVQAQAPGPRYGFEVPQIFEDANLDDLYNECFDESLRLYSLLQGSNREDVAGYAALMGHKVRWQLNATAADLFNAYCHSDAVFKPLLARVIESATEVHPLLWDVLMGKVSSRGTNAGQGRVKPYRQRHKSGRGNKPKKS